MSANARSAIAAALSASRPRSSIEGDGIVGEGKPLRHGTDDRDVQVEDGDQDRRARDCDEDSGHPGRDSPDNEHDGETAEAESRRRRVDLVDVPGEVADVVDEPPARHRDTEEPGQLGGDHDERDAREVAEADRLREQVGEEAEPGDRPDQEE